MPRSKRFAILADQDINQDTYIHEWPELGLIAMDSPLDPKPSLRLDAGRVVEMDGRSREQFDLIDQFIADYALDLNRAEEAMAMDSLAIARMLVDINTPRAELISLFNSVTPAKLVEVVGHLNVVEMMMALQKVRARQAPANQAHVTNWQEHPALLAADAARGGLARLCRGRGQRLEWLATPH